MDAIVFRKRMKSKSFKNTIFKNYEVRLLLQENYELFVSKVHVKPRHLYTVEMKQGQRL